MIKNFLIGVDCSLIELGKRMSRVVILQSNYIPWRGYFDLINDADIFIFYDEVQYTRRDWRNRNIIVSKQGEQWLSLPVKQSGKYFQSILDTEIAAPNWAKKHWGSLRNVYGKSLGYPKWGALTESLYSQLSDELSLTKVNRLFITEICKALNINTEFKCSSTIESQQGKTERLVGLCQAVGGSEYISGPAAKDYIDESQFKKAGIHLKWKSYPQYQPYLQKDGNYRVGVTILDTLFQSPDLHPLAISE